MLLKCHYHWNKLICLPFQRHIIHCNRLLLSENTALWMVRSLTKCTKFNIFSADDQSKEQKELSLQFQHWWSYWWANSQVIVTNKYHVKTEHLCLLMMNEWKANGKLLFNLLRSGIVSSGNVSFWHIWSVTHPYSPCHIFAQR